MDANYIAIYNKLEVNYFDAKTTKIVVSNNIVLTGWQCPKTRHWRVPLVEQPMNVNIDTILLDHPTKLENPSNPRACANPPGTGHK